MNHVFVALAERLGRPPLWIEFERYAAVVFAGRAPTGDADAHRHADALLQAQRLVRSDVVAVPVLDPWLRNAAWCAEAGASPAEAVARCTHDGPQQQFITTLLDALFHRIGTQAMLVLALPSPSQVLRHGGRLPPFGFGDLDDVAAGLTTVLRRHCTRDFGALALRCDAPDGLSEDESEACEPLLKSARYYGWGTALRLDAVPEGTRPSAPGFDAVLLGQWSERALDAAGLDAAAGGLGEAFWSAAPRPLHRTALRYGEIPPDAVPEQVVRHLQVVHGAAS